MTDTSPMNTFIDGITRPATYFISPAHRLFIPALLASILMAVGAYFYYQRKGRLGTGTSISNILAYLFPKRIWTHKSSVIDYEMMFVNSVLYLFLIAPFLVHFALMTDFVRTLWVSGLGEAAQGNLSRTNILVTYTLAIFFIDDFLRFFQHWLFHKIPLMWAFHKVHHAAEVLTPFTNYRSHPCEEFIYHCRRVFSYGVVTGTFLYFVDNNLSLLDISYASTARIVFNHIGANLRHSHIWISWGTVMEHIFISPAQHQIHHSVAPEHRDKNLGSALAIWDWMFVSLMVAVEQKDLNLGIGDDQNKRFRSLRGALTSPFIDARKMIISFPQTLKDLTSPRR